MISVAAQEERAKNVISLTAEECAGAGIILVLQALRKCSSTVGAARSSKKERTRRKMGENWLSSPKLSLLGVFPSRKRSHSGRMRTILRCMVSADRTLAAARLSTERTRTSHKNLRRNPRGVMESKFCDVYRFSENSQWHTCG